MNFESRFGIGDKVCVKGTVTGVNFVEGKVQYVLSFDNEPAKNGWCRQQLHIDSDYVEPVA